MTVFTGGANGWELGEQPTPLRWGGVWPWHNGRVTAIKASGSAKVYRPEGLTIGCETQPNWGGLILNSTQYLWDLR